jgi:NodT family efflux transporter outer membrane factor (OMF) lipoprotein
MPQLRLLATLIAMAVAGCTMGPDFEKPAPLWQPAQFDRHDTGGAASVPAPLPVVDAYWGLFNDRELTALEQRVAHANLDVRLALLRLAEARSVAGIAGAAALPAVNGNVNATREAQSGRGVVALLGGSGSPATSANGTGGTTSGIPNPLSSPLTQPINLYQYGFDASWEIDLWGRVKRSVESAEASADVSAENANGILVTSQAELARDYIQLRGIQADIAVVQRNLDADRQTLDLLRQRFRNGLTTELDVTNEASLLAATEALLPDLLQQQAQTINAMSFLLGEKPSALRAELATAEPIPPVPPVVPVGLPSELTRRRSDIRAAEAQLHAATADVGVAVADFYPRFSLSASAAIQALQPHYLDEWSARTFGFGPSVTLPIFEGGRLTRTLELRKTTQMEAALLYQRTVLMALHDVDNALIAYSTEQTRHSQLAEALALNRKALDMARDRYTGGVGDFLTVLDSERRVLAAEQALNESQTKISINLVQLYKALGGGWEAAAIRATVASPSS